MTDAPASPRLVVFGGLPGAGKTTVARLVATRLAATYLRIDSIEQAIRDAGVLAGEIGPAGYGVANALAAANLALGRSVVADAVNAVAAARQGWRDAAARAGARLVEIELVCSDPAEHRRRVESRASDIPGLALPTWRAVQERSYEPWTSADAVIETAAVDPDAVADEVLAVIAAPASAHHLGSPADAERGSYQAALPGGFLVSDDRGRLDMGFVLDALAGTYWAKYRSAALTERSWQHSLCFGVYGPEGRQAGFARLLTDYALRAHLGDVYIDPARRNAGLGRGLVTAVLAHPALATVMHWTLMTADAQGFYARFGFRPRAGDGKWLTMEREPAA